MRYTPRSKPTIGNKERALLEDIQFGDFIYGFLASAGSTKLLYKQMHRHAQERIETEQRRIIKQRLVALEKKNLIRFEQHGEEKRAVLTMQGTSQLDDHKVMMAMKRKKKQKWDGKWRIVSFDIPQEHKQYRRGIRKLLLLCGFRKIEQSVYASPHFAQELYDYLQENQVLGGHVHFFEGRYLGNDAALRKEFGLDR